MKRTICSCILGLALVRAFLIVPKSHPTHPYSRPDGRLFASNDKVTIHYSLNFDRHLVSIVDRDENNVNKGKQLRLESFLWLEDAKQTYPNATLAPLSCAAAEFIMNQDPNVIQNSTIVAGCGDKTILSYEFTTTDSQEPSLLQDFLKSTSQWKSTNKKYKSVINSLEAKLGSTFYGHFPPADQLWIQERILFFLAPQPPSDYRNQNDKNEPRRSFASDDARDWACALWDGYGVGLTESQTVTAILALRHILALYPNDSSDGKPNAGYFYNRLKLTFDQVEKTRVRLGSKLKGADPADLMTFAYLHSLGVSWDQCQIILEALSLSLVACEVEPSWDLNRPVRAQLLPNELQYLRMRLHLSPAEILGMLKVHSRLSYYPIQMLKLHMDTLQTELGLSSKELRQLVVKAPSVLGLSTKKLEEKVSFFSDTINMTEVQIRKVALQIPATLFYSLEANLKPKIRYLESHLGITADDLTKVIVSNPPLLCRSLNQTLKATVQCMEQEFSFDSAEIRQAIIQVPQLLTMNWRTTLKQKTIYLQKRLGLSDSGLIALLKSCPRLLTHNIERSLEIKLQLLESAACGNSTMVSDAVVKNPSLLLTNKAQLQKRVYAFVASEGNVTFLDTFGGRSDPGIPPQSRRKRPVLECLEDGRLVQTLPSVEVAALEAGTSKNNMYNIIKTKRKFQGKLYKYGALPEALSGLEEGRGSRKTKAFKKDVPEGRSMRLSEILQVSSGLAHTGINEDVVKEKQNYLALFVSSQIHPLKQDSQTRGMRIAGGHSIYLPQLQGSRSGGKLLRTAAERLFGNLMPSDTNGTSYVNGTLSLGYPYKRPTRNRCELYGCREALRLVSQLLVLNPDDDFKKATLHLDIFTDSNYAWGLLHNSTNLLRWGSYEQNDVPELQANVDILHPLSRTYYRLINQDFVTIRGEKVKAKAIAKDIVIHFRHVSEVKVWSEEDSRLHLIHDYAKKAAYRQYIRANEVTSSIQQAMSEQRSVIDFL